MRFKDDSGQTWKLSVNMATLMGIKRELGVDLLDNLNEFPTSLETLFSCVWICCFEDIKARRLNEADFATLMNGPALGRAVEAFVFELADFYEPLSPDKAAAIRNMWSLTKETSKLSSDQVIAVFGSLPEALATAKQPTRKPRRQKRKRAKSRA